MRLVVIGAAVACLLNSSPAWPQSTAELLRQYETLNGKCRGGSGDNPLTTTYCKQRDELFEVLGRRGWCYGEAGQAGYEKKWHECAPKAQAKEQIPAMPGNVSSCVSAIDDIQRAFALAFVASICQIRSERFFVTIRDARQDTFGRVPQCLLAAKNEGAALEVELARTYQDEQSRVGFVQANNNTLGPACRTLAARRDLLARLDAVYGQVTLNRR